ncbi:MAG: fumarylacetoacetate hydrolase family protein [Porticoccaceae bacterium]|jgi:2-keto-4-pentenoate hydratase/2-oxohepta-3-ene-1,7-dioic acid hydratase in catechol pathway|nr:fumarylacetoacetate hydrolase family protein [Porticoccaceae bacterium]MEA3298934.1 fumarylacetoacetate hydrolase family protein [Pseudomonadota bacterium]HLS99193.1 fumarylacetoacetate hydrolase family protein [Porticoccaceae bacterium]
MLSSEAVYRHRFIDGRPFLRGPGKVVCVGRNYAAHARELGNPIPDEPLLFIKPATALVALEQPLVIARRFQPCHYETEISVLIGKTLTEAAPDAAREAIAGIGVALDLTLRELQDRLKAEGQPWEKAKAFDGSCGLSPFVPAGGLDLDAIHLRLVRNGVEAQHGDSGQMLFPILDLLCRISAYFTLVPGDVVLTGTPEGVGALADGDSLRAELPGLLAVDTTVVYR